MQTHTNHMTIFTSTCMCLLPREPMITICLSLDTKYDTILDKQECDKSTTKRGHCGTRPYTGRSRGRLGWTSLKQTILKLNAGELDISIITATGFEDILVRFRALNWAQSSLIIYVDLDVSRRPCHQMWSFQVRQINSIADLTLPGDDRMPNSASERNSLDNGFFGLGSLFTIRASRLVS